MGGDIAELDDDDKMRHFLRGKKMGDIRRGPHFC